MRSLRSSAVCLLLLVLAVAQPLADDPADPPTPPPTPPPATLPTSPPTAPSRLLLTNVRVFDVEAGVMTAPRNILIDGGRIAAVGSAEDTGAAGKAGEAGNAGDAGDPGDAGTTGNAASGAVAIDCAGKYAVPGLFDSHTHVTNLRMMGDEEIDKTLGRFVEQGITQLRDVGGPLETLQSLRARIESGELRGPDIFYTGPMLEQSPLTWAQINMANPGFTVAIDSLPDAERIVPELVAGGARCVKVFNKFDRDVFTRVVDLALAASLPVVHDPGPPLFHRVPIDFSIDCGVSSIEHGKAPWPIVLVDSLAQEQDELARAKATSEQRMAFVAKVAALGTAGIATDKLQAVFDKMIARGVYFCPTLHVFVQMAQQPGAHDEASPMATIQKGMEEVSRYFTHEAAVRGVKILVGQDGVFPEGTLAEMRHLRDCGLSAADILRGATIYPAQFLNATDRYGAIAPGRVANILVLDQDPLAAIENIEAAFMVVQNGQVIPREKDASGE